MNRPHDIIEVEHADIACEGESGALGHPRVYLHVDDRTGQIQCPYCSRLYLLRNTHQNVA